MTGLEELEEWDDEDNEKWGDQWARDRELIDALLAVESGLSEREIAFIESVSRHLAKDGILRQLTQPQRRWADQIARRLNA